MDGWNRHNCIFIVLPSAINQAEEEEEEENEKQWQVVEHDGMVGDCILEILVLQIYGESVRSSLWIDGVQKEVWSYFIVCR